MPDVERITPSASLGPEGSEAVRKRARSDSSILVPLSPRDRLRLAAEVLSVYVQARWRLWRTDLSATVRSLRSGAPDQQRVERGLESHWQGVRLAKATTRTLALLPTDTRCLMQSLVLLGLLSRRGIESVLVVAVKSDPDFRAHAWVEHNERPLLPTGGYGRLVEL